MGFFDSLLGRSKPVRANLDALFALPEAALTLQAGAGFVPTGRGSVCFRANEGAAFTSMQAEVQQLLDADGGPKVQANVDSYGFTWLLCEQTPDDVSGLVTELHAVNSTLEDNGFGSSLLCSLVTFADSGGRQLALVYLYKRGTFYPFAPSGPAGSERRDNALELQTRGLVSGDVPIEKDLTRWLAVWGAPGLS